MKKINIGAGFRWYKEGWDVLDNGSGKTHNNWKHFGVCWDTKLKSSTYNIVFSSHMIEHVPHFKLEKTFSEFNRILKIGGTIRIATPDLKKTASSYISGNTNFFKTSQIHTNENVGIGGMFLDTIISPGHQTLAIQPDFSEVLGSYAHTYSFDYEMLKIFLSKWGFSKIQKSSYCKSNIEELREKNVITDGFKNYDIHDKIAINKIKNDNNLYLTGFDNAEEISLYVEAVKEKDIKYSIDMEFEYTKNRSRVDTILKLKIKIFKFINLLIDLSYSIYKKIKKIAKFNKK